MEKYTLSIVTKTLTISKAFEKAAENHASEEFNLYRKLIQEIPDLKVCRQTHRTPSKYCNKAGEVFTCNQFKNLTYERMEQFICALPNKAEYMTQYEKIKAAAAVQTSPYTMVRTWFLLQFPQFRSSPWTYFEKPIEVVQATEIIKVAA